MKRSINILSILLIVATVMFSSCNKDDGPTPGEGKAIVRIGGSVNLEVNEHSDTRATSTDIKDFTVIIINTADNTEVVKELMPSDGSNPSYELDMGTYSITLTSHPAGIPAPAFDVPVYSDTKNVTLENGDRTRLDFVCTQINAGIYFTYHQSLADMQIVPTIEHSEGTLVYPANDSEPIGYFAPGNITVSFTKDGSVIKVNGKESHEVRLAAADLWEINLRTTLDGNGELVISAVVIEVKDPNHKEEWILGEDSEPQNPLPDQKLERWGSVTYFGGEKASEVIMDFYDEEYELNMYIRAFTTKSDFENLVLTPGEYSIVTYDPDAEGDPMTFVGGFYDKQNNRLYPSHFAEYANGLELGTTAAYMPSSGKMVIELLDDIYIITVTFSGTHIDFQNNKTETVFSNVIWQYEGGIYSWKDNSPQEGAVNMSDIVEGTWTAIGTPSYLEESGPGSWTFELSKSTNYLTFGTWAGIACPVWLDYSKGFFYMDSGSVLDQYFQGQTETRNAVFCAVGIDDDYVYFSRSHPVKYDKETQTFDFSGKITVAHPVTQVQYELEVCVGIIGINKVSRTFDGSFSELYKDLKVSYCSGLRSASTMAMERDGSGLYMFADKKPRKIIYVEPIALNGANSFK